MKKIFLLTFFLILNTTVSKSQNNGLQMFLANGVYLINQYHIGENVPFSNDIGLNQIMDSYFTFYVYTEPFAPYFVFQDENGLEIYRLNVVSSNLNLISDLSNSVAVKSVSVINDQLNMQMSDRLLITLVDLNNGVYTGISNNIVETNNIDLNVIFQNFNVNKYENQHIRCNCNVVNLKNALDNLPTVIQNTDYVPYNVLLNRDDFNNQNSLIYPNPFSKSVNIQTNDVILKYELIDITGKALLSTSNKYELDSKTEQLEKGVYFLSIDFENGKWSKNKIVKN